LLEFVLIVLYSLQSSISWDTTAYPVVDRTSEDCGVRGISLLVPGSGKQDSRTNVEGEDDEFRIPENLHSKNVELILCHQSHVGDVFAQYLTICSNVHGSQHTQSFSNNVSTPFNSQQHQHIDPNTTSYAPVQMK
jgi:hypothetical protein